MITKEQALEAYNTLKDYCRGQERCDDCLLVSSSDSIHADCCLMHFADIPSVWQNLELD